MWEGSIRKEKGSESCMRRGQLLSSRFLFPRAIEVVRRVASSRKLHK